MAPSTAFHARTFLQNSSLSLPFRALVMWTLYHFFLLFLAFVVVTIAMILIASGQGTFSPPLIFLAYAIGPYVIETAITFIAISYIITYVYYGRLRYEMQEDTLCVYNYGIAQRTLHIRYPDMQWIYVSGGESFSILMIQSPRAILQWLLAVFKQPRSVLYGVFHLYQVRIIPSHGRPIVLEGVGEREAQAFRALRPGLGTC